ncbi:DUF2767 family protein [Serratia ficaria]|uniref:Uncharacterized protein n=1 Tax=Serratia ficaria TaxID=61651 RepID=A0A240BTP8_SERFI|nr:MULTISPECIES: DUF2767 family protein [Serratia]MEE4484149.1 DUF2767 family protein [Serratia ficaria]REF45328.1 uncharacterized protein DUF2767 [Serratia ficaria]CAI0698822.1 Uncharacterised protein [Serratia ficaria]CAI0841019.1 Uncharacterised protein [Serratia ficaria]CAI0882938.1 Uncharacterised protein [Serratia ficaria]
MHPNKPIEFDEEICLVIGRAVLEVVKLGGETSAPAVMDAIEVAVERPGVTESAVAAADDALDLMARLIQ